MNTSDIWCTLVSLTNHIKGWWLSIKWAKEKFVWDQADPPKTFLTLKNFYNAFTNLKNAWLKERLIGNTSEFDIYNPN